MNFQNRKNFFRTNRFQWPIILTGLIPTFFFCTFSTFFVVFLHGELINLIKYNSHVRSMDLINEWGFAVLVSIWVFFILAYVWIQSASSRSVGAFSRILKELDKKIEANDFSALVRARERDTLANELVKRINKLLEKIQKPKIGGDASKSIGRF